LSTRLLSLDVFRGGTIAAMILVNNPGSWSNVYAPLLHADWHGWTFTDLVFPFFLWIVGVSITFSLARRVAAGDGRGKLMVHVLRRSALIFLLGLLLNGFPYYRLATIRIPGVLQRIAICYLIAAAIFLFTRTRGRVISIAVVLSLYWVLMMYAPVPGFDPGGLDVQGNFAQYVDGLFLSGHMYSQTKTWDPEGIVSTLPSIATALFGVLAGQLLRSGLTPERITAWMFFSGNLMIFGGLMLSTWMPINKKLWTASFSVFMAGMAWVVFACCYWLVDVLGWKRFARPFAIYGMNAITVYVLSGLLARMLGIIRVDGRPLQAVLYENVFVTLASPKNASLLYALANVLLLYGAAYVMHRRKWFVRL
jgi:predicted acyltransferase